MNAAWAWREEYDVSETKSDNNFYFTVIVLLVIMIAAMAGLWVIEHKKLAKAVSFISVQQKQQQSQDGKLRDMILNAEVEKNHMLNREAFAKKSVMIDGRPAEVFVIAQADGAKAGLVEGDIIFVGALPAAATTQKTAENKTTGQ